MSGGTMRVVIMYRNNWFGGDGWTYYSMSIEISDKCQLCGGSRGEPKSNNYHEDGEWRALDNWVNPCGHKDMYRAVYIEGQQILKNQGEEYDEDALGDQK